MSQIQHSCSQLLSKLFLALDNELSEDEEKQFQAELNECSWCLEHYNVEKQFKDFLAMKIAKKQVSPDLVNSIRQKIEAAAVVQ